MHFRTAEYRVQSHATFRTSGAVMIGRESCCEKSRHGLPRPRRYADRIEAPEARLGREHELAHGCTLVDGVCDQDDSDYLDVRDALEDSDESACVTVGIRNIGVPTGRVTAVAEASPCSLWATTTPARSGSIAVTDSTGFDGVYDVGAATPSVPARGGYHRVGHSHTAW